MGHPANDRYFELAPWKLSLFGDHRNVGLLNAQALAEPDRTAFDVRCGEVLHCESPVRLDDPPNTPGPSSLMVCPDASACIAMEVLEEKNIVLPVRIGLKLLCVSVHWSPARAILHERRDQPLSQRLPHLEQVHQIA